MTHKHFQPCLAWRMEHSLLSNIRLGWFYLYLKKATKKFFHQIESRKLKLINQKDFFVIKKLALFVSLEGAIHRHQYTSDRPLIDLPTEFYDPVILPVQQRKVICWCWCQMGHIYKINRHKCQFTNNVDCFWYNIVGTLNLPIFAHKCLGGQGWSCLYKMVLR